MVGESVRDLTQWQDRRAQTLESMQLVMGPLPDRSDLESLKVEVIETVKVAGIERRRINYLAEQGDRVPAYLLIPGGLVNPAPAMLCLHQTTAIGKGEPAGPGGNPNLHYGLELAKRGYVTLIPDYPGFGDNEFDPYTHGYASASMKGIWNHMLAVEIASLPLSVKGFGHIKDAAATCADERRTELLADWHDPAAHADAAE